MVANPGDEMPGADDERVAESDTPVVGHRIRVAI
jgi:hypothetical protein